MLPCICGAVHSSQDRRRWWLGLVYLLRMVGHQHPQEGQNGLPSQLPYCREQPSFCVQKSTEAGERCSEMPRLVGKAPLLADSAFITFSRSTLQPSPHLADSPEFPLLALGPCSPMPGFLLIFTTRLYLNYFSSRKLL